MANLDKIRKLYKELGALLGEEEGPHNYKEESGEGSYEHEKKEYNQKDMDDGGQQNLTDMEPEVDDIPESAQKDKGEGDEPELGVKGEGGGPDDLESGGGLGKDKKKKMYSAYLKKYVK